MRSADWRERVVRVIERFASTVPNFYSPEHANAGHIVAIDRDGRTRNFPMLTLSVAALDSETFGASSAESIAQIITHVKKLAKQQHGNSFVLRSDERVFNLLAQSQQQGTDEISLENVG
jgi:hypothetical protein